MPKKQLAQLLLFVFVDVIGYSLFFPLLPYYATEFGAGTALVGLMIASNAGAQFIVSPIVGRLADRFGRRPLIMISIIGTMLSFLLLAYVKPASEILADNINIVWQRQGIESQAAAWAIGLMFFCRILDGVAGGNVSLARAYVSDITTEEHRAQGLGMIGAAFGFGFVIGPAIGGTLSNLSQIAVWMEGAGLSRFSIPAFAAVILSLVNLIGVYFFLPESLPVQNRTVITADNKRVTRLFAIRNYEPYVYKLLGFRLWFSIAITMFMANFAIFTQNYLGLTDQATSYVLTYAGVLLILVQAVGIRWLTQRYTEWIIVSRTSIIVAGSLFCLGISSGAASLMIILFPLAISGGILNTIINSLISKSVDRDKVGSALGLATSMESLSWIIAPIIGGVIIDFFGGLVFAVVSGAIASLMIPYVLLIVRKNEDDQKA
jgi:DHA1 family tetracycline resistance protein-like MFS transporter